MFERFTDRARRVVVLAQEESRMLNHNYIGTEHILLGLIHEGEGAAAQTLESLGISLEAVRDEVREMIGQGTSAPAGHIPFTPRAKKVLELSLREALHLQHDYIGTEHILLGLIREGEGVAAQVLQKLGADLSATRKKVLEVLSDQFRPGPTIETTEVAERLARVEEVERRAVEVAAEFDSDEVEPEHHWIAALRLNLEQMEEAVEAYRAKLRNAESRLTERRGKGRRRKQKPSGQPDG
jgi:ATP-dependent Clp protease ATP-binding subunit ClpA